MSREQTPDFIEWDTQIPNQDDKLNYKVINCGRLDGDYALNRPNSSELASGNYESISAGSTESYYVQSPSLIPAEIVGFPPHQNSGFSQFGEAINCGSPMSLISIDGNIPAPSLGSSLRFPQPTRNYSGHGIFQYSDANANGEEVGWGYGGMDQHYVSMHAGAGQFNLGSEMAGGSGTSVQEQEAPYMGSEIDGYGALIHEDSDQFDPKLEIMGNSETNVQEQEAPYVEINDGSVLMHEDSDRFDLKLEMTENSETNFQEQEAKDVNRAQSSGNAVKTTKSRVGGRRYKAYRARIDLPGGRVREFICSIGGCNFDFANPSSLRKHQQQKHESEERYSAECLYPECHSKVWADTCGQAYCNMKTHQRKKHKGKLSFRIDLVEGSSDA
ncbi:hypothetical protein TWF730_007041 [Orbilia blumenaviensis]|uniref:C2H2-type domain-containing protein n=1 Tax=Orbilia blumenaviensis TaxID=1796055 RepID=A0AAV9VIC7_9PEZI